MMISGFFKIIIILLVFVVYYSVCLKKKINKKKKRQEKKKICKNFKMIFILIFKYCLFYMFDVYFSLFQFGIFLQMLYIYM